MDDAWELGTAYEQFMGRWSWPVADRFLAWLAPEAAQRWVDVGCGTGALSRRIESQTDVQSVIGVDSSSGFIKHAQTQSQHSKIEFRVGSADSLPLDTRQADYVVSGLALNFFPDPVAAVVEMARVARSSGCVAVYVWDYADKMEMLRYFWDAAQLIDPSSARLDEGTRFPLCNREALRQTFANANLEQIEVTALDTIATFSDFADYWQPFLGRNGPAPSYVASLSGEKQQELAARLQEVLPVAADGTISITMRALAVRGRKQ